MAGSVNKCVLIGRLGRDPETKTFGNGGKATSFSLATSETWKDKSGERQSKTQWHNVVIFNEKIGEIAERFLKKGSCVYLEGAIENRKYTTKEGAEREGALIAGEWQTDLVMSILEQEYRAISVSWPVPDVT